MEKILKCSKTDIETDDIISDGEINSSDKENDCESDNILQNLVPTRDTENLYNEVILLDEETLYNNSEIEINRENYNNQLQIIESNVSALSEVLREILDRVQHIEEMMKKMENFIEETKLIIIGITTLVENSKNECNDLLPLISIENLFEFEEKLSDIPSLATSFQKYLSNHTMCRDLRSFTKTVITQIYSIELQQQINFTGVKGKTGLKDLFSTQIILTSASVRDPRRTGGNSSVQHYKGTASTTGNNNSGATSTSNNNAIVNTPVHVSSSYHKGGPYFDRAASKNVTAMLGKTAYLNCRVKNLGNKTMSLKVSWVRHRDVHLLTVGRYTYTSDQRFRAIHQPHSEDWTLQIKYAQLRDSGIYECQISSTPHLSHYIYLNVVQPTAEILGSREIYIDRGSTINLTCIIHNSPEPPAFIFWNHNGEIISYDSPRGGVNIVMTKGPIMSSSLLIEKAIPSYSGQYQCNPSNAQAPPSVTVHVLNGEQPEAMQHSATTCPSQHCMSIVWTTIILLIPFVLLQQSTT